MKMVFVMLTDASKAVGVATNLISKSKCLPFIESIKKEYQELKNSYYKKVKNWKRK